MLVWEGKFGLRDFTSLKEESLEMPSLLNGVSLLVSLPTVASELVASECSHSLSQRLPATPESSSLLLLAITSPDTSWPEELAMKTRPVTWCKTNLLSSQVKWLCEWKILIVILKELKKQMIIITGFVHYPESYLILMLFGLIVFQIIYTVYIYSFLWSLDNL